MNAPLAHVVDLAAFRQRRGIRRAAALALVGFAVVSGLWRAADAVRVLEAAIRKGADLLGPAE